MENSISHMHDDLVKAKIPSVVNDIFRCCKDNFITGYHPNTKDVFKEIIPYQLGIQEVRDWNHPYMSNPFWAFFYAFEPGLFMQVDNQEFELTPSTLIAIPANLKFKRISKRKNIKHMWFNFYYERRLARHDTPIIVPLDIITEQMLNKIKSIVSKDIPDSNKLYYLCNSFINYCLCDESFQWDKTLPDNIYRIISWIEKHYMENISNSDLATVGNVTKRTIIRYFKDYLGKSPHEYITEIRIKNAYKMLSATDLSIEAIAEKVGFGSRHSFYRAFKRVLNKSPKQIRSTQSYLPENYFIF
jgi:AraC-like DNA-binding protein